MYLEGSGFGDHILYKMCQDYPLNNDPEIVGGKLWLIGRAYAAAVERKAGEDFDWEPLKAEISKSDLDENIKKCQTIRRIEPENLSQVLLTHNILTKIFKNTTKLEKRSLASKFLHFHAPSAFFIYDSMASLALRQEVKADRRLKRDPAHDPTYEEFCNRCIRYRAALEASTGVKYSPRSLDTDLLQRAKLIAKAKRAST